MHEPCVFLRHGFHHSLRSPPCLDNRQGEIPFCHGPVPRPCGAGKACGHHCRNRPAVGRIGASAALYRMVETYGNSERVACCAYCRVGHSRATVVVVHAMRPLVGAAVHRGRVQLDFASGPPKPLRCAKGLVRLLAVAVAYRSRLMGIGPPVVGNRRKCNGVLRLVGLHHQRLVVLDLCGWIRPTALFEPFGRGGRADRLVFPGHIRPETSPCIHYNTAVHCLAMFSGLAAYGGHPSR